ncbi:unnamed protein product [Phytomonas sp. EM1]|nr:unnamed protein product [Phytomonas sp. EM1]|eukprot:CCW60980.1 unnamed protein product [Phytomonas sp. isolate EM1]
MPVDGAAEKPNVSQCAGAGDKSRMKEGMFAYLQAVCPYATPAQLSAVLLSTDDIEKAVRCLYDAHNPDISGINCLKEQWSSKLNTEDEGNSSSRVNPFEGVDLLLTNRAREIFRNGYFSNLSLTRDYNYTVRVFPVDTSEWDREVLLKPRLLQDALRQRLTLADEEMPGSSSTLPPNWTSFNMPSQPSRANLQTVAGSSGQRPSSRFEGAPKAPIIRWLAGFSSVGFSAQNLPQRTETDILDRLFSLNDYSKTYPLETVSIKPPKDTGRDSEKFDAMETPELFCPIIPNETFSSNGADEGEGSRYSMTFSQEEGASHRHETQPSTLHKEDNHITPFRARSPREKQANTKLPGKTQSSSPISELHDFKSEDSQGNRPLNSPRFEANPKIPPSPSDPTAGMKPGALRVASSKNVSFPITQREHGEMDILDVILSQGSENVRFLIEEKNRWKAITFLLGNFSNVFRGENSCDLVKEVFTRCPLFVEQIDDIMHALLLLLAQEVPGWRLVSPLEEISVYVPFLGPKLLSTSEFKIKELLFDQSKSSCQFVDNGVCLEVRIFISKLLFHPIQFAFIGESNASRQNRQMNSIHSHGYKVFAYTKGVTNGELKVKMRDVNIKLRAKVLIAFKDFPEILIEEASVSVKSLKLSNSVTKLDLLYTLMKPYITSIVEKGIHDALIGSHRL